MRSGRAVGEGKAADEQPFSAGNMIVTFQIRNCLFHLNRKNPHCCSHERKLGFILPLLPELAFKLSEDRS